jgi:hypothetical protein
MSAQSFTTAFAVEQTPQKAFDAIVNVRGWWSQDIDGGTDAVGDEFSYRYQDSHRSLIRVTEVVPGRKVSWLVLDNYFAFASGPDEWKDTTVEFEISPSADGTTEVRFTHVGLIPSYECYDACSNAWGSLVGGSLRSLIATGTGQPLPRT